LAIRGHAVGRRVRATAGKHRGKNTSQTQRQGPARRAAEQGRGWVAAVKHQWGGKEVLTPGQFGGRAAGLGRLAFTK
jgi:hypothetical protein